MKHRAQQPTPRQDRSDTRPSVARALSGRPTGERPTAAHNPGHPTAAPRSTAPRPAAPRPRVQPPVPPAPAPDAHVPVARVGGSRRGVDRTEPPRTLAARAVATGALAGRMAPPSTEGPKLGMPTLGHPKPAAPSPEPAAHPAPTLDAPHTAHPTGTPRAARAQVGTVTARSRKPRTGRPGIGRAAGGPTSASPLLLAAAADLRRLVKRVAFASTPNSVIVAVLITLGVVAGCGGDAGPTIASGTALHGGGGAGGDTDTVGKPAAVPVAPLTVANGQAPEAFPSSPVVAPMGQRVDPDVFIRTKTPITASQLKLVEEKTGSTRALLLAFGSVKIATGSTLALGVDPSTFRNWNPLVNAQRDDLWQRVAAGDAAVAHTVFDTQALTLGGDTTIGPNATSTLQFRVGAEATTGIQGIGVVVSSKYDQVLNLEPDTGLLLYAPGKDPVLTASTAADVLINGVASQGATSNAGGTSTGGDGVIATPVHYAQASSDNPGQWFIPAYGPLTQGFRNGATATFFGHPGIDIGSHYGALIYAASAGTVKYAGPAAGYGNDVIIDHAGGVETLYGHMEKILVSAGDAVRGGQPIALVGSEGDSTGPHLHFEVHLPDSSLTNPLAWLRSHGVKIGG